MILGPDNAFWIDGEWLAWHNIPEPDDWGSGRLAELECLAELRLMYPKASELALVPYFRDLLSMAEAFHRDTGRHLNVYGDLGELFGAIKFGIKLNKAYAQGSDGRLGNDHVEIKTITPFKRHDRVTVDTTGNFSKLLVVKIDRDFQVAGRIVSRKDIARRGRRLCTVKWDDLETLA